MAITGASCPGLLNEVEQKALNDLEIPYYMETVISDYLLLPKKDDAFKKNRHGAYHHFLLKSGKK